jgi:GDP/UDP-N,N'-diacetylbacillosamine 2-epimerase (hydrolysing)
LAMGESRNRILEVGEPGLDLIRELDFVSPSDLAAELDLDPERPIVVGAQHPVTTEAAQAASQMEETLEALAELGLQAVFSYPNSDAGGREMARVLESYRGRPFLRIVANLGSRKYLSLLRIASVLVGNSSSGILEAPSFKLPVVNVGTRQHARVRANNVIDVAHDRGAIAGAVRAALGEPFRERLKDCVNPYGDGHTAVRTVEVLERLRLGPPLISKWIDTAGELLDAV